MDEKKLIESCYSVGDLTLKLFGRSNSKYTEKTLAFLMINGYSKDFFENKNKNKRYEYLIKVCPVCQIEFKTITGHKNERNTCSIACSNSFKPKRKKLRIIKKIKRTHSKKRSDYKKNCIICNAEFEGTKKVKSCSEKCRSELLKLNMKDRIESGNHRGWTSRKIESYPERFFKKVLDLNKILYEFNFPVSKKSLGLELCSNYFLDFLIEINGAKLDLEIDGKQHEMNDRKKSDLERDEALIKNGYLVHRIKWKNPINVGNKKYIKNEITKLLELIKSLQ
jgi:very-short-patch-repair endonuclease